MKGIAFERFLGRTFRGEIGQFFTPRTIVEFMIRMMDPKEGEVICDPASGSGGFLIRFFEIERRADLSEGERAEALREEFERIQRQIDPAREAVGAEYAPEIKVEVERLSRLITGAKEAGDAERKKVLRKERRDYKKQMKVKKKKEARALLKQRFSYHVFLYDAEHVGITATGEEDLNELYPNENQPPGLEKTCVELYRAFEQDAEAFLLDGQHEAAEEDAIMEAGEEKRLR